MNHEIIKLFLSRGYLVGPEFINNLPKEFDQEIISKIQKDPQLLDEYLKNLAGGGVLDLNCSKFGNIEYCTPQFVKEITNELKEERIVEGVKSYESKVIVLKEYKEKVKKREVADFVSYFRCRFDSIKKILINRPELQDMISISKLKFQPDNKKVALMGLISEKNETKAGNLLLELEDVTGKIRLIITKNKEELFKDAKDLVLDEVIGITGSSKEGIVFVDNILYPDIPSNLEIKKSPDESYAVFISDIHYGLDKFLEEDFNNFINWLRGEYGSDTQKEIAKNIKYLFISGDLVEGVGVYPNQDNDLTIKDVYAQYEGIANILSKIPEKIKIIVCAGNHDALRISEPQPSFDIKFAKPLFDLKNVTLVTNPSMVNIHSSNEFPGFNVLIYHGFSFPYYSENIESIRLAGGQARSDLIMQFLLKRRHLAPTHGSTLYMPDACEDSLVIDKLPDFFVSGHIHRVNISNYKNIACINASCWVTQSQDQERRGIIPDPSRAVVVNLKTRDTKIMNFGK